MKKIETQRVRKSVPRGFGKREKPSPRSDFANVHKARRLCDLLSEQLPSADYSPTFREQSDTINHKNLVEDAMIAIKYWLKDVEHEYRMLDMADEQDVIVGLIERLENG